MIKLHLPEQPGVKRWNRNLELRVENDPNRKHRQLVSLLSVKHEKFAPGPHGHLQHSHWEVPIIDLRQILRRFQRHEILATPEVNQLIAEYDYHLTDIDMLPREELRPFPAGCPIVLDDYQEDYVCWPSNILRPFNVWDVGLGKTIGALARLNQTGFNRVLIVTIKNNANGWPVDIRKFFGQHTEAVVYYGTGREKLKQAVRDARFVIVTYESAVELDLETNIFDNFIMDEVNMLFNYKNQRSQNFEKIFDATWRTGNERCQLATATPVGNRVQTVWNMMRWEHPLKAGTFKSFSDRYVKREEVMTTYKEKVSSTGITYKREATFAKKNATINKEELSKILTSRMAVKYQEDVARWSEQISLIKCDMSEKQKAFYDEVRNETLKKVSIFDRELNVDQAFQRLGRCLQAGEGLFNFEERNLFDLPEEEYGSGKFERLCELLPEHGKAIVLARFRKMPLLLFKKFFKDAVIHIGDTHNEDRRLARWAFQGCADAVELSEFTALAKKRDFHLGPGEAKYFLMTLDSRGSAGMNFPICDINYLTSFSLNHVDNKQGTGRIRRKTQVNDLLRHRYLISGGTCERAWLIYVLKIASEARGLISGASGLTKDALSIFLNALQHEVSD